MSVIKSIINTIKALFHSPAFQREKDSILVVVFEDETIVYHQTPEDNFLIEKHYPVGFRDLLLAIHKEFQNLNVIPDNKEKTILIYD